MFWTGWVTGKIRATRRSTVCDRPSGKTSMNEAVIEIESPKTGEVERAAYEHPWAVRFSHWLNSVSLLVMVASGFQIFRAFPSFGAKIPQKDLLHWPQAFALGGWLGGGLQWHLTFVWIYIATG